MLAALIGVGIAEGMRGARIRGPPPVIDRSPNRSRGEIVLGLVFIEDPRNALNAPRPDVLRE